MADEPVKVVEGQKRVRAYLGGELVADTTRPLLVWERPFYPTYYLPTEDVITDLLVDTGTTGTSRNLGEYARLDVKAGGQEATGAARRYAKSPVQEVRDAVRLDFKAFEWFEEDEPISVHPKDPYTRVDILRSSRNVRIEIDGVVVAETDQPTFLFETGIPRRTYLPRTDVKLDLLTHTDLVTECPYKGQAEYWSVTVGEEVHENVVWSYAFPTHESAQIAGLMSFYDEKVDVYVDGELQTWTR